MNHFMKQDYARQFAALKNTDFDKYNDDTLPAIDAEDHPKKLNPFSDANRRSHQQIEGAQWRFV